MNLYHVRLKGMKGTAGGHCAYGDAYVVAPDPAEAYQKVRGFLDKEDIGFTSDRCLESMSLIASNDRYPDCGYRLYL